MRIVCNQFQNLVLANVEFTFHEVGFGQVHFGFQVVRQESWQDALIKVDGQFVILFTDAEVGLVHVGVIYVWIGLAHKLVDLFGVLVFVKEGEDVGNSEARKAVVLVVRQNIKVLVISFHQKFILLIILICFTLDSFFECNISQTQEAIWVISHNIFKDKNEFGFCILCPTGVEEEFAFHAMLVYWGLSSTFAGFLNPMEGAVHVASLFSKVGHTEKCINIIWLLLGNLLIPNVGLVELMV